MTRILSLDPGHTIGVAIYDEDGKLEVSMAVPKDTIFLKGFLNSLIRMSNPDIVLIENLPYHRTDPETNKVWLHFSSWFKIAGFEVVNIGPGQWKGLVERVEIPGQHARDAATMAKWYIKNQQGG